MNLATLRQRMNQHLSQLRHWFAGQLRALKRMDADDLDLQRAGQWPDLVKIFSLLLILGLTTFAAHWLVISQNNEQLEQMQAEQARLLQAYQSKAFQAAHLPAYRAQMAEIEERLDHLLDQLPAASEVPRLLEDIQRQADQQSLEVLALELRPETRGDFYAELPFEIRVRGDYHQLATFIEGISQLDRVITLHDFQLQPTTAQASKLTLSLQAKTYRYDAPEDQGGTP